MSGTGMVIPQIGVLIMWKSFVFTTHSFILIEISLYLLFNQI